MKSKGSIDWNYKGKTDYSNGTGAYLEEKLLGMSSAILIPIVIICLYYFGKIDWNFTQLIIVLFLATDISGGVVSNMLNSCKRFYHTPPKPNEGKPGKVLKNPIVFSSFHVHAIIIALLFTEWTIWVGILWYVLFLLSVMVILVTPLYLKRPVSILLFMLCFLGSLYFSPIISGLEWLLPLLFLKILYGHLVKEEPYRKVKNG